MDDNTTSKSIGSVHPSEASTQKSSGVRGASNGAVRDSTLADKRARKNNKNTRRAISGMVAVVAIGVLLTVVGGLKKQEGGCPLGYQPSSSKNGDKCVIACKRGFIPSENGETCVLDCPPGSIGKVLNGMSQCIKDCLPAYKPSENGDTCVSACAPVLKPSENGETCISACPRHFVPNSKGTKCKIECKEGYQKNTVNGQDTCTFSCPKGLKASGEETCVPDCGVGFVLSEDGGECIIVCEAGYSPSLTGEDCIIDCEVGYTPSEDGDQCILDCPQRYWRPSENGETCILDCPPDYSESGNAQTCIIDICGSPGRITSEQQKIDNIEGGLRHVIEEGQYFGEALASMGDLDGNGAFDFAVGIGEYDYDFSFGSVLVVFLNRDHTVLKETRIGNGVGGLGSKIPEGAYFGTAVGCLGDLDGDGIPELIVGADGDDEFRGALYVLFMLASGMVKMQQKVGHTEGGLDAFISLEEGAFWATSLSVVGELDESGTVGVLVGTGEEDVYYLRLKADGTVGSAKLLKPIPGRRDGVGGMADVGDVDGNGVVDVALGAPYQQDSRGAVYILLMQAPGDTVLSETLIRSNTGGMALLRNDFLFGWSVAGLGDLDGDGTPDIAVGAIDKGPWDEDEWGAGSVSIMLLKPDGSVKGVNIISADKGGLVVGGGLKAGANFGAAIATLVGRGDSEQGVVKLVVGAWSDGASVEGGGSVYVITVPPGFVELLCPAVNEHCIQTGDTSYECGVIECEAGFSVSEKDGETCGIDCPEQNRIPSEDGQTCVFGCPPDYMPSSGNEGTCIIDICGSSGDLTAEQQKIDNAEGGLSHEIQEEQRFGEALASMGDLDGNGAVDFAVGIGEYGDEYVGSVLVVFLKPDRTVLKETRIGNAGGGGEASTVGGLESVLPSEAYFGNAVGCLGDLDDDGVPELIVGAYGDDETRGALYVLFMLDTGMVKKQQKIGYSEGGLDAFITLGVDGWFGSEVGVVGELDESGTVGVLVSDAYGNGDIRLLRLKADGTLGSAKTLTSIHGRGEYGEGGLVAVGDVNGDGVVDLGVGSPYQDKERGGIYILLMEPEDKILKQQLIRSKKGGMGVLKTGVYFGLSMSGLGDLDGDGTPDIAVGVTDTPPLNDAEWGAGSVFILLMNPDARVKRSAAIGSTRGGLKAGYVGAGDNFGSAIATLVTRGDSEQGVVTLVVGAWNVGSSVEGGGAVYVLTVPPGFVDLCPVATQKCVNSGETSYECVDS